MRTPSPDPYRKLSMPTRGPKAPAAPKGLLQRGLVTLRNITGVQALVALAALGAAGYGVHEYTGGTTVGIDENERAAKIPSYTPERYPTLESRVTYLSEKYGIFASVLDGDALYDQNHLKIRTETEECGCKTEHFTEHDLPRKVTKGDPKHLLPFLDGICRAADRYPVEIFQNMRGLTLQMSGKIEIKGISGGTIAGYADGPSHIVMEYSPDTAENQVTFHHEFFHTLDFRHHDLRSDDDQWIAKAASKDTYLGYELVLDDPPWDPPEGFARKYGRASVPEDQATMGENFFQPHYLKFMLRRALNGDRSLLMKIQLLTASIIDPHTERFSRVMTPAEYQIYSGFHGYRYYHAWTTKMDHHFWNGILDELSPEVDSRKHLARNIHDAHADLVYHILGDDASRAGDHLRAADNYRNAHEMNLATEQYLVEAADLEKEGLLPEAAVAYDGAGEQAKATQLYEKSALQAVEKRLWSGAALYYAKAGNVTQSHRYAQAFFEEVEKEKNSPLKLMGPDNLEIFVIDDRLMEVSEQCYHWKNIPDIGIALLHTMAKKRGGMVAVTVYEKLGKVQEMAIASAKPKGHTGEYDHSVPVDTLVDRWYIKMAKRLESSESLDKVALLYEKGGSYEDAQRCLELYKHSSMKSDWTGLAGAFRALADLVSREKLEHPPETRLK